MGNITTTTTNDSRVNEILALLTSIGAQFNDAKIVTTAINIRKRAACESLAIKIVELDDSDRLQIMNWIDCAARTPKHALCAFAKAINKVIKTLNEGSEAFSRV